MAKQELQDIDIYIYIYVSGYVFLYMALDQWIKHDIVWECGVEGWCIMPSLLTCDVKVLCHISEAGDVEMWCVNKLCVMPVMSRCYVLCKWCVMPVMYYASDVVLVMFWCVVSVMLLCYTNNVEVWRIMQEVWHASDVDVWCKYVMSSLTLRCDALCCSSDDADWRRHHQDDAVSRVVNSNRVQDVYASPGKLLRSASHDSHMTVKLSTIGWLNKCLVNNPTHISQCCK